MNADAIAGDKAAINPQALVGKPEDLKRANGRRKIPRGVFGVKAEFHRMTLGADIFLPCREYFTSCYAQLPFHQIKAGDGFRHRVFHLKACIHLKKIEPAILGDEFHRAGALILHGLGGGHCGGTHGIAHLNADAWRRRFFDHFLMPALRGTIPFKQMHRIAVAIAKHLHFNMPRAFQITFDQHAIIAKGRCPFLPRGAQCFREISRRAHHAHTAPTTAGDSLDDKRKADSLGLICKKCRILFCAVITRQKRHAGFFHQRLG